MAKQREYHTKDYWTTHFNDYEPMHEELGLDLPESVRFYDVTLREVDQCPGHVVRADEKIEIAKDLDKLGIYACEIFPLVSQDDFEALKEISSWKDRKIETSGLCRVVPADIDCVAATGADRATIESPISMAFGRLYGNENEEQILTRMKDAIKYAQSLGFKKICCEAWDAGRVSVEYLERFYKEIAETGADEIVFADSGDYMMPWTVYYLVKQIRKWTEDKIKIVPHFHNEFGNATASTLSAIAAGCDLAHCAIDNIGERAGNAAMEELAVDLEVLLGIDTGLDLSRLYPTCAKVCEIAKMPIHENKPILGPRPNSLGSGLVAEAYLSFDNDMDRMTMTPFNTEIIGAPELEIIWGKGVGSKMVQMHAQKDLGITLTREQAAAVRDMIKNEALIRKAKLDVFEVDQMIRNI